MSEYLCASFILRKMLHCWPSVSTEHPGWADLSLPWLDLHRLAWVRSLLKCRNIHVCIWQIFVCLTERCFIGRQFRSYWCLFPSSPSCMDSFSQNLPFISRWKDFNFWNSWCQKKQIPWLGKQTSGSTTGASSWRSSGLMEELFESQVSRNYS